ncbi:MAG: 4Fe-4S binding protein [Methanobacteriaceae archaeon]
MKLIIVESKCNGCGDCIPECPVEALSLNEDQIAVVDEEICNLCELCIDVCPTNAIELKE